MTRGWEERRKSGMKKQGGMKRGEKGRGGSVQPINHDVYAQNE